MASKKIKLTSQTAWETQKDLNDNFADIDERLDAVPTKTSDLTNDGDGTSPFATEEYVDENGGKIDSISVNGTAQTIDANKNVDIDVPTALSELTNDANFVQDASYVHTDNNYTTTEKNKLAGIEDGAEVNVIEEVKVNNTALTPSSKSVNIDLSNYSVIGETGAIIALEMDSSTYEVTAKLKDKNGNVISTSSSIDLPIESVVVSGSYDSATKEVVLTLQGGSTIRFSVADLVSGLQTEITSTNKLDADLVDDSTSANKFVSATDKSNWNAKYDKPAGGIPASDLADSYYPANNPNGYTKVESSQTNGNIKINNSEVTVYTLPNDVARTSDIPDELADLADDATHRLVTDTEKATWNAKQDAVANLTFTDDDSRWSAVDANGFYTLTIVSSLIPEKVFKNGSNNLKQEVMATANYDGTNIYIITDTKFSGSVSVK